MIVFRIDDIGASSKHYNQHTKHRWLDFWFLKRIKPFARWAVYNELTAQEWLRFLDIFEKYNIKPIVSVTAAWVNENSRLTPFPEKFPEQAKLLKTAFLNDKIIIANHGLTHCVVGKHLPKFWTGNRKYHREFWSYLSQNVHNEHIIKSQNILESFFEKPIKMFVPPGSIWSIKTYLALKQTNIRQVISKNYMMDSEQDMQDIEFIDDRQDFFNFHDRELKLYGKEWLIKKIQEYKA